MNSFRRFQQGAQVIYRGTKFAKELQGAVGIVNGFVEGDPTGVTVTFGSDAYIMDEHRHLDPFQGKVRNEKGEKDDRPAGPAVEKRKGISKRRVVDQESDE